MEREALQLFAAAQRKGLGLHCIQNPAGSWSFVGTVPMSLRYVRKDGEPMDDELAQKMASFGVGLFRNVVRTLSWPTRDEAIAEAEAQGFSVQQPR